MNSRLRGASTCSTPSGNCTRMTTERGSVCQSVSKGARTRSASARLRSSSSGSKGRLARALHRLDARPFLEGEVEVEPPGRLAEDPGAVLRRLAPDQLRHHRHVAGDAARQPAGYHVEVAAVEEQQRHHLAAPAIGSRMMRMERPSSPRGTMARIARESALPKPGTAPSPPLRSPAAARSRGGGRCGGSAAPAGPARSCAGAASPARRSRARRPPACRGRRRSPRG